MKHLTSAAPGSVEYLKATAGMITASQAASVLCPGEPGVYGTPLDVYVKLRKALDGAIDEEPEFDDEPEDDDMLVEHSERAELSWGLDSEPMHRDLLRKYAGLDIEDSGGTFADTEIPWLAATPDGLVREGGGDKYGVLELKAPTDGGRRLWAAGPPKGYVIQANVQMRVMRADWGVVSALIPPKPRWERVYNSPEMQEFILTGLTRFMEDHVIPGVPPPITGSEKDLKALKQLFPISTSKRIVFSMAAAGAASKFEEAKNAIKAWEDVKRVNQGILMQELQDAEVGVLPDGSGYSFKSTVQNRQAQPAKTLTVRTLRKVKEA
jgi:hypothetical protein